MFELHYSVDLSKLNDDDDNSSSSSGGGTDAMTGCDVDYCKVGRYHARSEDNFADLRPQLKNEKS